MQDESFVPASIDPAGNVAFVGSEWLSLPDAFGRDTEGVSMTAFPHVFAGLELLPGSGGYQLSQSRLFDGSVGRFARMDPLGVEGGPSRFTYAENDPTSLWDPAGLSAEGCGQAQLPRPMGGEPTEGVQKIEGAGLYYHSLHESVPPADVVQAYLEGMFATLDRQAESRRRGPAPIGAPTALGVVGGRVANPEDATRRLAPGAGAQDSDSSDAEDEKDATYGGSGEVVVEWVPSDEPAAADEPVDDSPILPQHSALVGKGAERRSPLGVRPDGVRRNGWGATESFTRQLAQETSALAERQEAAPGSDASTWTRMSYAISRGTSRTRIGIQAVGFAVRHPELSVPALIEHTPLGTGVEEVAESLAEGDSLAEALVSGVVVGQTDGLLTCAGGMKAVADSTTNVTLSALQVPLTGTASTAYVLTGEVYGPYADAGALIDEHVDLSPDATTVLSTALRPAMASRGGARPRYVPRVPNGEPLPLPSGPNRELAPSSMDPHTQIGWREGRNGGYVQTREFWPNGEPVKQVDCTDHGRPGRRTDPHVHAYSPNPTGGSPQLGPARPPELGEL